MHVEPVSFAGVYQRKLSNQEDSMKSRYALLASLALATWIVPRATAAQTPVRFSGAAALALPIGDLGDAADVGFSLALRGEAKLTSPGWSVRGDLSWDRFSGKGVVDSYSYLGVAANLVHRDGAGRVYEFGGLGLYGSKTAFADALDHDDTNLGMQFGLGLDFNTAPHAPFVEFGLTNVFTSGGNSLWFPVRFGVRF
jgi:hypothetical protein